MEEIVLYKDVKAFRKLTLFLTVFVAIEIFAFVYAIVYEYSAFFIVTLATFTAIFAGALVYNVVKFLITPKILLKANEESVTLFYSKKVSKELKYTKIKNISYVDASRKVLESIKIKVKDNEFTITNMDNGKEVYEALKARVNK